MANNYKRFFFETPEGATFMAKLDDLIEAEHKRAEENPDMARDHTQRANGIRQVCVTITSMSADYKKGKTPRE